MFGFGRGKSAARPIGPAGRGPVASLRVRGFGLEVTGPGEGRDGGAGSGTNRHNNLQIKNRTSDQKENQSTDLI